MKNTSRFWHSGRKETEKPIEQCDDEKLKPFITKNIANHLGVTPHTIIPNLKIMEASGLLSSRRGAIKRGEPAGRKMWGKNLAPDR
jgi:predicted ArsR family transcriptional regulator